MHPHFQQPDYLRRQTVRSSTQNHLSRLETPNPCNDSFFDFARTIPFATFRSISKSPYTAALLTPIREPVLKSGFVLLVNLVHRRHTAGLPLETLHIRAKTGGEKHCVVIPSGRGMQTPILDLQVLRLSHVRQPPIHCPLAEPSRRNCPFLYDIPISL